VIANVQVELIFWGQDWQKGSLPSQEVTDATKTVMASPYMSGLKQYGVKGARFKGSVSITNWQAPQGFVTGDTQKVVAAMVAAGKVDAPQDNSQMLYVVMVPQGVKTGENADGMHSYYHYVSVDALGLPSVGVAHFAWVSSNGDLGTTMTRTVHEIIEAASDPEGTGWKASMWVSQFRAGWDEIADACSVADMFKGGPQEQEGGVSVPSYWSQADQACIVPLQGSVLKLTPGT
jgi:hypothetical protein